MARKLKTVRKIETPRGPGFETRVNVTARDGSRTQLRRRFRTSAVAADWHHRTSTALADGAFFARSSLTVKQACEAWLRVKAELKPRLGRAAASLGSSADEFVASWVSCYSETSLSPSFSERVSATVT